MIHFTITLLTISRRLFPNLSSARSITQTLPLPSSEPLKAPTTYQTWRQPFSPRIRVS